MKKHTHLLCAIAIVILSVLPLKAQNIELGVSPLALVYQTSADNYKYYNAYSFLMEFSLEEVPTDFLYSIRFDAYDGNNQQDMGDDRSYQNIGFGVRYKMLTFGKFGTSAFGHAGLLLVDPHEKHRASQKDQYDSLAMVSFRSQMPSLVNFTLGVSLDWYATEVVLPYFEVSLLQSIKLKSDEKTQLESIAMRLGVRFKV
jgi:hypothetical protein